MIQLLATAHTFAAAITPYYSNWLQLQIPLLALYLEKSCHRLGTRRYSNH